MTNYEKILNMSVEDMGQALCDMWAEHNPTGDACAGCPVFDLCNRAQMGFVEYLNREAE